MPQPLFSCSWCGRKCASPLERDMHETGCKHNPANRKTPKPSGHVLRCYWCDTIFSGDNERKVWNAYNKHVKSQHQDKINSE